MESTIFRLHDSNSILVCLLKYLFSLTKGIAGGINQIKGKCLSIISLFDQHSLLKFETVAELLSRLKEYFEFYNFERPYQSLVGKTPAEIYWGRDVVKKAA